MNLLTNYDSEEDAVPIPELPKKKIRTFGHVDGNFATCIYLSCLI